MILPLLLLLLLPQQLQEALASPCYSAWLAITGRALLAVGRLFETAPTWFQQCMQESRAGKCPAGVVAVMSLHASAMGWVAEQLSELSQHPTSAPAARLPPGLLQEMVQLCGSIGPRFESLLETCDSAPLVVGGHLAAEAAVFRAFLQGCSEGWLREGLQKLGAAMWAAWPQKYACNDDQCLNMDCLSENSCGRQSCGGCKVSHKAIPNLIITAVLFSSYIVFIYVSFALCLLAGCQVSRCARHALEKNMRASKMTLTLQHSISIIIVMESSITTLNHAAFQFP